MDREQDKDADRRERLARMLEGHGLPEVLARKAAVDAYPPPTLTNAQIADLCEPVRR